MGRLVLLFLEEDLELLRIDISAAISIYQFKDLLQLAVETWAQGKHVAFFCIFAVGRYMLRKRVDFTPGAGHAASSIFDSCRGSYGSKWLRVDLRGLCHFALLGLNCALSFLTNLLQRDQLRELL